ncbi:MAG: PhzF family phenazine biosynthesis protein [Candidatus Baltobacteraceae bacterium]
MHLKFQQIDVFTTGKFSGNPLAVFWDADGLNDTQTMQRIAREMNLSETTFVQRSADPVCAFKVRIFTPGAELPFAGHPTLGTAFVLDRLGLLPGGDFSFEEGVGPVRLHKDERRRFWMFPPEPKIVQTIDAKAEIARALGVAEHAMVAAPQRIDGGGSVFLCVILDDARTVDAITIDRAALARATSGEIGDGFLLVFSYHEGKAYSRMFASVQTGIGEDPATGGSVATLCCALQAAGKLAPDRSALTIEQGVKMGRRSFLHAQFQRDDDRLANLSVGGDSVFIFESVLEL